MAVLALKNISIGERFLASFWKKIEYRRSYRIIKNKVLPYHYWNYISSLIFSAS